MKKNVCLIGIMLWALSCFWACSDDEDGVCPKGTVQIYGRAYDLASGVIWQNNPNVVASTVPYVWEDRYVNDAGNEVVDRVEGFETGEDRIETGNFLLSLYEEGLVFNEALEAAKGNAASVCFHIASPDKQRLAPGKYVFDASKKPNTFIGYCSSGYDTQGAVVPAALASGEVTVESLGGEEYRVVFQCTTTFGGEISGTYSGKLDFCRVSQVSSMEYAGVSLAGLLEEVEVTYWYSREFIEGMMALFPGCSFEDLVDMFGLVIDGDKLISLEDSEVDYDTEYSGDALFSLTSGICQLAKDARKNPEAIDLALVWNQAKEVFSFESPISIRSLLGHNKRYDFPCHTVYMKAPADFTDSDFDNLSADDFSFRIEEEKVEISVQNFKPSYVFFQTGRGVQGVIKITGYIPMGVKTDYDIYGGRYVDYPRNPALLLEIKCPAVVANPQIR